MLAIPIPFAIQVEMATPSRFELPISSLTGFQTANQGGSLTQNRKRPMGILSVAHRAGGTASAVRL